MILNFHQGQWMFAEARRTAYNDQGYPPGKNNVRDRLVSPVSFLPRLTFVATDAPWCSLTSTHASKKHIDTLPASLKSAYFPPATKPEQFVYAKPVKGRNEPTATGGVAWVVHKLNPGVPFEKITEKGWKNTVDVFGLEEL